MATSGPDFDAVVIGAGVVGLACAQALAARGLATLVVERHAGFGVETSSRNSEVVHAGMYYPTGSLKARLCVRGNVSLAAWCDRHEVVIEKIGKLIVATCAEEEAALDAILARARANGVAHLEPVNAAWIASREPHVVATRGLWSPNTGIVDSHALMGSLQADARAHGAELAYRHRLVAAHHTRDGYALSIASNEGEVLSITASRVVNSAGLAADEVASMIGLDVDALGYRLTFVKGRYFKLRGRRVRHLVYPVPPPKLLGLGVHVTIDLGGGERLGPDTEVLAARVHDYDVGDDRKQAFFQAARRYLRGLSIDDLSPDYAGIRPKLTPVDG
ncbi:MAG: NAD(P)/FAD-dependent oxidoreductase, partial [Polyangiales bacterium]